MLGKNLYFCFIGVECSVNVSYIFWWCYWILLYLCWFLFSLVLLSFAKTGVLESSAVFLSLLLALLFLASCVLKLFFQHTHIQHHCFLDGSIVLSSCDIPLCPSWCLTLKSVVPNMGPVWTWSLLSPSLMFAWHVFSILFLPYRFHLKWVSCTPVFSW